MRDSIFNNLKICASYFSYCTVNVLHKHKVVREISRTRIYTHGIFFPRLFLQQHVDILHLFQIQIFPSLPGMYRMCFSGVLTNCSAVIIIVRTSFLFASHTCSELIWIIFVYVAYRFVGT